MSLRVAKNGSPSEGLGCNRLSGGYPEPLLMLQAVDEEILRSKFQAILLGSDVTIEIRLF